MGHEYHGSEKLVSVWIYGPLHSIEPIADIVIMMKKLVRQVIGPRGESNNIILLNRHTI